MVRLPATPELNRAARDRGRSAALTIGIVLLSLVVVAAAMRWLVASEPVSHRVVVGAQGCGGACDGMLARSLAGSLRALGFDAVAPTGEQGGLGGPEATRAFAREHAARFAVTMVVAIEGRTQLTGSQWTRVNANASVYVMDAQDEDAPSPAFMLRSVDEGRDEQSALELLGKRFLGALFPGTASALLSSEPVNALQEHAASMEQQAAALAMKKHSRHLAARTQAMREYQQHCERNAALLASQRDATCVSAGCAEEYVVGVLPDGRAAVVHDSSNTAVFPLAKNSTARSFPTAERLWLVSLEAEGKPERTLLAEASNFYSQPSLSRDGSSIAYVERRHGSSRLYAGRLRDRGRVRIHEVAAPARISEPQLSPDGSAVLFFVIEQGGGPATLLHSRVAAGVEPRSLLPHALDARWVELAPPGAEAPELLVAALVPEGSDPSEPALELDPRDARLTELWLLDPATGRVLDRVQDPQHRLRALGDVQEGALLLGFADDAVDGVPSLACGFARYRPGAPIEWRKTALCPKHIAVGQAGAFAHAVLPELSSGEATRQLVKLDARGVRPLTRSQHDLQRPRPAARSDLLVYEHVSPRAYGEFQHVAVCFRHAG